jgi:hypothetical protein
MNRCFIKRGLFSHLLTLAVLLFGLFSSHWVLANDRVLVVRSEGSNFSETLKGLQDDLADDVTFIDRPVGDDIDSEVIGQYIQELKPALLVFLGNNPLYAYREYQKQHVNRSFPPAIVLSALYLDRQLKIVKNTIGVRHEIPAVTSLVQLRSIIKHPVKKVGVVYREWMSDFIEQNKAYCQQEGIELIAIKLSNTVSIGRLSYHLKHLVRQDIDALWVANDNGLLQARLLQNAWLPVLKGFKKPVLVGIQDLTKTNLNFGTFSVEADPYALGVQGAEMISDIMDNGWKIAEHAVEQPLSIHNILNVRLSEGKGIKLDLDKLGQIDRLIR